MLATSRALPTRVSVRRIVVLTLTVALVRGVPVTLRGVRLLALMLSLVVASWLVLLMERLLLMPLLRLLLLSRLLRRLLGTRLLGLLLAALIGLRLLSPISPLMRLALLPLLLLLLLLLRRSSSRSGLGWLRLLLRGLVAILIV